MASVRDLINETRSHLHGAWRQEYNEVQAQVATNDGTVRMKYDLKGIVPGSYISINDELMYVWSAHPETKTVTVRRQMEGTVVAIHNAGDLVEVNPTFPKYAIRRALSEEILSWPTSVYRVTTKTVTVSEDYQSQGVALNFGDFYHVLRVQHANDSGATSRNKSWPDVNYWRVDREADSDDFGASDALIIDEPVPTGKVKVTYSVPFDVSFFTDGADLQSQVGLATSMNDIPSIGAAVRLQAGREISRSLTQPAGDPRLAEAVPPNSILQGAFGLKQLRDQRLAEEARRLQAKYPLGHT